MAFVFERNTGIYRFLFSNIMNAHTNNCLNHSEPLVINGTTIHLSVTTEKHSS